MAAPRVGVGRVGRVGAKVGEDLVDHRRLRHAGDEAHRAAAGGTGERVDLDNLLHEDRPSASGLGRRDSWRGNEHGACVDGGGLILTSYPRGRLACQP